MLLGIQQLLDTPNCESPAQAPAYRDYIHDQPKYRRLVKEVVRTNSTATIDERLATEYVLEKK